MYEPIHTPPLQDPSFVSILEIRKQQLAGASYHKSWWRILLFILFSLFLFIVAFSSAALVSAYTTAKKAQDLLPQVQEAIHNKDLTLASHLLHQTQNNIHFANEQFSLARFFSFIPVIRQQYFAGKTIIETADTLSTDGVKLFDASEPILSIFLTTSYGNMTPEQKKDLLAMIPTLKDEFNQLSQDTRQKSETVKNLPTAGLLRQIASITTQVDAALPQLVETLDIARTWIDLAPSFLGSDASRRYLVLFLNNRELRPGGGFIGSYGIMNIQNGEIESFPISDIYDLDRTFPQGEKPPKPIADYLSPKWFMRDSNWSPDYPTSAAKTLAFYRTESGDTDHIDGIIALTPRVIEALLMHTGNISVPGYPYTFTPENFTETLQDAVEYDFLNLGIDDVDRKQILTGLHKELLNRIFDLDSTEIARFAEEFVGLVKERQFFVSLTPSFPQATKRNDALAAIQWSGAIPKTTGDFLMLVDANFYALKSDPVVHRSIDYTVSETSKGELVAHAVVTYQHTGQLDNFTDRYQTYTRLFVPKGSKLLTAKNLDSDVTTTTEEGKTAFGFLKRIEPQSSQTIELTYTLPQSIRDMVANGTYTLSVPKQLGGYPHELTVTFQGAHNIQSTAPNNLLLQKNGDRERTFVTDLRYNRIFSIILRTS